MSATNLPYSCPFLTPRGLVRDVFTPRRASVLHTVEMKNIDEFQEKSSKDRIVEVSGQSGKRVWKKPLLEPGADLAVVVLPFISVKDGD